MIQQHSSALLGVLEATKPLIEEFDMGLMEECRRIHVQLHSSDFSVAVVGEFSRGKSTLLNRMLNRELLPVGVLPTTALISKISYGSEPVMWQVNAEGHRERLPLSEESWEQLFDQELNNIKNWIEISIPEPKLKNGIILIDTPGAGDLDEARAQVTAQTIASCHATLVAVSATMALSLTEKTFIEEHIFARHIPRIALVITRLDEVPAKQRASVVRYVQEKIKSWKTEVIICCAHRAPVLPEETPLDYSGPEELFELLNNWAIEPERLKRRQQQNKLQINALLGELQTRVQAHQAAAQLSEQQKQDALQQAESQLQRNRLAWDELEVEMGQRENDCMAWLSQELSDKKQDLLGKLHAQLQQTADLKKWWQESLPFSLSQELKGLARQVEAELQSRLKEDASWLIEQSQKRFSWPLKVAPSNPTIQERPLDFQTGITELQDLHRVRLMARIGSAAMTLFTFWWMGPIGSAVTIGGGIFTEYLLNKSIESQKEELSSVLERIVGQRFYEWTRHIQPELHQIYTVIRREVRQQEDKWFSVQREALIANIKPSDENVRFFDQFLAQITELKAKLHTI